MNSLPMTKIGNVEVSRLLCGTNSFYGHSHFSDARSRWLRKYFSLDRIVEVMAACVEEGVTGIVSGSHEEMPKAIAKTQEVTGVKMTWFATPHGSTLQELLDNVRQAKEWGADFCMPHTSYTDSNLMIAEKRIAGADEYLALARELGMGTGWSTHRPETIVVSDAAGYNVDVNIQPFNSIGFLCPVETDWVASIIRNSPTPVIAIKPLGAGRIMPPTGLPFVYGNIKPMDTVCIGLLSPEEAQEDIKIVRNLLMGANEEIALQQTRSKAALTGK
jgi:hypothetical protein